MSELFKYVRNTTQKEWGSQKNNGHFIVIFRQVSY